jgi:DNA-binding transcriptional ArsR family regulator
MDAREIARRLGSLSIEERVQIINALMDVSPAALDIHAIAGATELGVTAIHKQLEALVAAELVEAKSVGSEKEYSLNTKMVRDLFDHMYHNFGPGFKPVPRPAVSEAEKE